MIARAITAPPLDFRGLVLLLHKAGNLSWNSDLTQNCETTGSSKRLGIATSASTIGLRLSHGQTALSLKYFPLFHMSVMWNTNPAWSGAGMNSSTIERM